MHHSSHNSPLTDAHRRHADRTAQLWMQRLKDSAPNKRLSLIYLANGMPETTSYPTAV